jgi:cytochrome P450
MIGAECRRSNLFSAQLSMMNVDISRIPPGPPNRFIIGSMPEFSRDPLGFLDHCAREYGDVVRICVPGPDAYVFFHPNDVEQVLVTQSRNFIKDRTLRLRPFKLVLGNGLLSSDGDFWKRQRRLAQPAFHRDRIAEYGRVMVLYAERMVETWQSGQTFDVHRQMMRLTLEIVARTLFNTDAEDDAEGIGAALEVAMDRFSSQGSLLRMLDNYLPTPGWLRLKGAVERLERIVYRMIEQHRAAERPPGDLLSMLLAARDEDGSAMTDQQLRDEVMTLFLAGHETTALALSWTIYLLGLHSQVESKLVEEIESVTGGRPLEIADAPRLRFTEKILKEAMRLYPPAWSIGRQAISECEIGGYRLPPGAQVFAVQWTTQRDPRFFESPSEFHPERWDETFEKSLPRFAYFPFGGGPRMCIGNQFAMMEATLILATIARRFRMNPITDHEVTPWPSITLRPRNGVWVTLERR